MGTSEEERTVEAVRLLAHEAILKGFASAKSVHDNEADPSYYSEMVEYVLNTYSTDSDAVSQAAIAYQLHGLEDMLFRSTALGYSAYIMLSKMLQNKEANHNIYSLVLEANEGAALDWTAGLVEFAPTEGELDNAQNFIDLWRGTE